MIHFIYVVTDKNGRIYKTNIKPVKWKTVWLESRNDMLSKIYIVTGKQIGRAHV